MAVQEYKCFKECFAFNKRFKKGAIFPPTWVDNGYKPPEEYFVKSEDYADVIRTKSRESKQVNSAVDDPRTSEQLIKELSRFMEVPQDWNRKRIWMALKQREMAEFKTEPIRKAGRPANPKE